MSVLYYCRILHILYFEVSFSGCLNTTRKPIVEYYTYPRRPRLRYLFQVVQAQTTTAYCRRLPLLDRYD